MEYAPGSLAILVTPRSPYPARAHPAPASPFHVTPTAACIGKRGRGAERQAECGAGVGCCNRSGLEGHWVVGVVAVVVVAVIGGGRRWSVVVGGGRWCSVVVGGGLPGFGGGWRWSLLVAGGR